MNLASAALLQAIDKSHERYAREFEALVDGILSVPARQTPMSLLARVMGWGLLIARAGWSESPAPYIGRSHIDAPSFR
jgi:hypothetical protein